MRTVDVLDMRSRGRGPVGDAFELTRIKQAAITSSPMSSQQRNLFGGAIVFSTPPKWVDAS